MINKQFRLSLSNPFVRDHKVYGQQLLPGLAYIDIIYQLFYSNDYAYGELELCNVSIFNPLSVGPEYDVMLSIQCTEVNEKQWRVLVEGREVRDGVQAPDIKRYITAEMHQKQPAFFDEVLDPELVKRSAKKSFDLKEMYARNRRRELIHTGVMKAEGKIYEVDNSAVIDISLGRQALPNAEDFMFHPALIDGSGIGAGALISSRDKEERLLFLPLHFESFRASALLQKRCFTRIQLSSIERKKELLSFSLEFFDESGKKVGELKNFINKLVRDVESINPDRKKALPPHPATLSPQPAKPVVDTPADGPGSNDTAACHEAEAFLRQLMAERLKRPADQIQLNAGYYEMGLDSPGLLELVRSIETKVNCALQPTLLFEYTTIAELAAHLAEKYASQFGRTGGAPRAVDRQQAAKERAAADNSGAGRNAAFKSKTFVFHEDEAFLQDHLVFGKPALMGAVHPCLALETYLDNHPDAFPVELKNVRFVGGPVTLKEKESVHVQVQFAEGGGTTGFKTMHHVSDPNNSKPCCSGDIGTRAAAIEPGKIDLKKILAQAEPLDRPTVSKVYRTIKDFTIGPMLRTIDAAYVTDDSTLISKVNLTGKLKKGNMERFLFDPLLLTACYHLYHKDYEREKRKDNIFVPFMIESLTVHRPMTETAYALTAVRFLKADYISFDAKVITEQGELIAELINASIKEVADPSLLSNASFDTFPDESNLVPASMVEEEKAEAWDIAVVGLAGRYPQSYDVDAFWENLRDGKDCITEIPKERWNWRDFYSRDRTLPGHIYSKWGGFIEDVDRFDPLFFNISPVEANIIDPQERLFLEHSWKALEDAGYTREKLQADSCAGGKVGVYVGIMSQEYPLYAAESTIRGRRLGLTAGTSSIANRVSYFFDFHGPSMALDTMCSGSLTAIFLACQALKAKQVDVGLAGGVNVIIHPNKYLMLSQSQFISSKGRCESFGEGGDGYIPGEGVGVLVLKRLADAKQDRDNIYGVIKSAAINHGGRSGGYTVPSRKAQSNVIADALEEAAIDPGTISYVEAHGTGTKLGDPIEIAGLNAAFAHEARKEQYCWIGSVKSNIGHCESAAGVAGVIKVLQQMRHGKIAPSLHSSTLNPNIDFSSTPFMVNQKLREWKRPVVSGKEHPRRAGVSSFGAGGSNSHLILEEYIPEAHVSPELRISPQNQAIIVLSARNEDRLCEQARLLSGWIEDRQLSDDDLADVAYTLQVGREAMEDRMALTASSVKELLKKLQGFAAGRDGIEDLYRGQVKAGKDMLSIFAADRDMEKAIDAWIVKKKFSKLLSLWVKGWKFDWSKFYDGVKPRRIRLPTYPFARERHWISEAGTNPVGAVEMHRSEIIHPLLHKNTSDLTVQRFSSTFSGREFFLHDHVVDKKRVLPGVAYLEMARAAVEQAAGVLADGLPGIRLKNVVWARPVVVEEQPVRVNIRLFSEGDSEIIFEIYCENTAKDLEKVVHSQGRAVLSTSENAPVLDLQDLQVQCSRNIITAAQYYDTFRTMNIEYGMGHRGIEMGYVGQGQVLAKLTLPSSVSATRNQYFLHPSLLDAALQATVGMYIGAGDSQQVDSISQPKPFLPFELQELEIFGPCIDSVMWALIRYNKGSKAGDKVQKMDIDLCDDQGIIRVRMKGFSARALESEIGAGSGMTAVPAFIEGMNTEEWTDIYPENIHSHCQNLLNRMAKQDTRFGHIQSRIRTQLKEMDELFCRLLWGQLQCVGIFSHQNPVMVDQKSKIGPHAVYDRWLGESLAILARHHYLQYYGGSYVAANKITVDINAVWEEWNEKKDIWIEDVDMKSRAVLAEATLSALPEILSGKVSTNDVMFPNSSMELVERIFKNNQVADYLNGVLADTLIAYIEERLQKDPLARIRVLEIGAVTGGTGEVVMQKLALYQQYIEEYCYTDVSKESLLHTKKEHGSQEPYLIYKIFNVETSVAGQGIDTNAYDIVIAANVLHATRNIRQTLRNVKAILQKNGLMILNEISCNSLFLHLTLGLLEKWWLYEDQELRIPGCPGIYPETWQKVLESEGFRSVFFPAREAHDFGQIIVAESDGIVLKKQLDEQSSIPMSKIATVEKTSKQKYQVMQAGEIHKEILRDKSTTYIKKIVGEILKMPVDKIDSSEPLVKYGVDSIMAVQLGNALSSIFENINNTLFFEYPSIDALIDHFLKTRENELKSLVGMAEKELDMETDDMLFPQAIPTHAKRFLGFQERAVIPSVPLQDIADDFAVLNEAALIHPLLHRNTSDISQCRFTSCFTGKEFFLADSIIQDGTVLPGVVCLEMARAAVQHAAWAGKKCPARITLKNVAWKRPIVISDQPVKVHIRLLPKDGDEIAYEIYRDAQAVDAQFSDSIVYSQGMAMMSSYKKVPSLDLSALPGNCTQSRGSSGRSTGTAELVEIAYESGHKGIERAYAGPGQVLAKLSKPPSVAHAQQQFVMHPGMMESALRASIGLMVGAGDTSAPVMPLALERLEILYKCAFTMWVRVRYGNGGRPAGKEPKLDLDFYDEEGKMCVRMIGLSWRFTKCKTGTSQGAATIGKMMLQTCWKERTVDSKAPALDYAEHLVVLCEPDEKLRKTIQTRINIGRCIILETLRKGIEERFNVYAVRLLEEIQRAIKDKKNGKALIQVVVASHGEQHLLSGVAGLLKTAHLEDPLLIGQLIEVDEWENGKAINKKLAECAKNSDDNHIRYQAGSRLVTGWSEVQNLFDTPEIPWKDRGVYLITGGVGGLGLIFAREIVKQVQNPTVVLLCRSKLNEAKQLELDELAASGARVEYKRVDVSRKKAVTDLIGCVVKEYGGLNGIIHSAGVINDGFILNKAKDDFLEVLAPKVKGTVNLDQASKDIFLDFFILFSSMVGSTGNYGQSDYATANAFMNAYAMYRNSLVVSRKRYGRSLSIEWPLWKDGGMHVHETTVNMIRQKMGMIPMRTAAGITAFYQALASDLDQIMVLEGELERLRAIFDVSVPDIDVMENRGMQKVIRKIIQNETLQSEDAADLLVDIDKLGNDEVNLLLDFIEAKEE